MDCTNEATPLAFSGQQVGGEALISPGFLILFTPSGPALPAPQAAVTVTHPSFFAFHSLFLRPRLLGYRKYLWFLGKGRSCY